MSLWPFLGLTYSRRTIKKLCDGRISVSGDDYPAFPYLPGSYHKDNLLIGCFRGPILVAVSHSLFENDVLFMWLDWAPHLPRSEISTQSDTWGSRNEGRPSKAPSDGGCHTSIHCICGNACKSIVFVSITFKFYLGLLVLIPIWWLVSWWWHIHDQQLLQPRCEYIRKGGNWGMDFWNPVLVGSVGPRFQISFHAHFVSLREVFMERKEKKRTKESGFSGTHWLFLQLEARKANARNGMSTVWLILSWRLTNCGMCSQKFMSVPQCMNIPLQVLMGSSMKRTCILPLLLHSWNGSPEFIDSPIQTMKNKKKLLWILQAHQSHLLSCPAHNSTHHQLLLIPDPHKRIHHMLPRLPRLHWWISRQKISPHHPNAHVQENLWSGMPTTFYMHKRK